MENKEYVKNIASAITDAIKEIYKSNKEFDIVQGIVESIEKDSVSEKITGVSVRINGQLFKAKTLTSIDLEINNLVYVLIYFNGRRDYCVIGKTSPIIPLKPGDIKSISDSVIDEILSGSYSMNGDGFLDADGLSKVISNILLKIEDKVSKVDGMGLSQNSYTNEEKEKLDSIESGAQVNQNAFSKIIVGDTEILSKHPIDQLEIEAGDNIVISVYDDLKKISISSSYEKYVLPIAGKELGGVKTTSLITDIGGYTPCPIVDGVPYYLHTELPDDESLSNPVMKSNFKFNRGGYLLSNKICFVSMSFSYNGTYPTNLNSPICVASGFPKAKVQAHGTGYHVKSATDAVICACYINTNGELWAAVPDGSTENYSSFINMWYLAN